jgi:hypothetical protein
MALLNGALATAGITAGVIIMARTRIALGQTRAPEEFGQSMFAGASGLLLAGIGAALGIASLADLWLYRRIRANIHPRAVHRFLLLITTLPGACAAVWLFISTIRDI